MCTVEKRGRVYILTITGADDEHRLNPTLLTAIRASLHQIRSSAQSRNKDNSSSSSAAAALVTAAQGKFFSNGFDLAWAKAASPHERGDLMASLHKQTVADLLSFPMPTVAAVTGHASAAGLVLALSHDRVVMRSDRGFLYMSETDIGLPIPDYFVAVARTKLGGGGRGLRRVVLEAGKVSAWEAEEMGVVDGTAAGVEGTVEAAVRMAEELAGKGWDGEVYAANRMAMVPEACRAVGMVVEGEEEKRRTVASKL